MILLIRPTLIGREYLEKESLGIPLGIMYLSSVLKQNNFDTKIIDYTVENNVNIKKIIEKYKPEIVGISATYSLQTVNALKIARMIKNIDKDILLVAGGNPATVIPEDFLGVFDIAVRGEGEFSMLEIAQGKELKDIKGISYKKNGKIIHNPPREWIFNLDKIPFPDYESVDLEKYFNPFLRLHFFEDIPERKIPILTSRGCPFSCFFCAVHLSSGRTWRPHSTEYVLNHMEFLIKNYKIEHIHFDDDNLTLDPKRFEAILDGMKKRNIKITWDSPNGVRLDTLNRRLIKKMKENGMTRLTIAIESGSQKVIDNVIHKNLNLKKALKIARICKEEGISLSAFYIVGLPGETKKDMETTLNLAMMLLKKYNVIPKVSIGTPLPGTEMTKLCEKNNYLKNGRVETEEFTSEDVDKYYKDFGRKLIIPFITNLNWVAVIKNMGKFPKMAKRILEPNYANKDYLPWSSRLWHKKDKKDG